MSAKGLGGSTQTSGTGNRWIGLFATASVAVRVKAVTVRLASAGMVEIEGESTSNGTAVTTTQAMNISGPLNGFNVGAELRRHGTQTISGPELVYVPADTPVRIVFEQPIYLRALANNGLLIIAATANVEISASFEWEEIPV